MKNVKYGKCVRCGKTYDAVPDLTNCECGGILDIVYDYDYIKSVLTKEKLQKREYRSMWRYRELLPVEETTPDTPLRVGWSPLYEEDRLAKLLGLKKLWVKDDGQNPPRPSRTVPPLWRSPRRRRRARRSSPARPRATRPRHSRQRRCRGSQDLHLRPLPRPQGQGRAADDLRRERHFRAGQL